jgi:hypothetical protein
VSDELRKEVRREVWRLRLGPGVKECALCGEDDLTVLKRASRTLVEFHHLAGRANDADLGVFLCLTHHAKCTEAMRLGVRLNRAERRSLLERLVAVLRGLAIFFELAAKVLQSLADELAALVDVLDAEQPGWRTIDSAS